MATEQPSGVLQHLRRAMLLRDGAGLTDGQLLQDYISRREEAALAALVQRHGPMVWGVCRRVLNNYHDAEDAFQATFLVLVRRAASIASPELLANWLYGVAHQTAIKARATVAKRKTRERQVTEMPEPAVVEQDLWNDLQPLLDQELSRLPDKFRGVIVLCDLEGKTRKEAAGQLGCAEGTVASRLARARIMLAKRLTGRGVALSGGALAAVLAQQPASAGVPYSVVDSTIKAASLLAAGKAAATGAISVKVAALTEGVLKAMLMSKLKAVVAAVLILGFMTTGATILTCRTAAGQDDKKPAAEKPVEPAAKQEKEKETFTAWGKEVGGLQAGLGFRPGEKRAYSHGETVTLVVRVRNVGKEEVKFQYLKEFFMEKPPTVTGGEGKTIRLGGVDLLGSIVHIPVDVNLAPGKEMELHDLKFKLGPASEGGDVTEVSPDALHGKGKFQIQYERVFGNSSAAGQIKLDPNLSKLATGKLELEVKEPERQPQKKEEKEAFTAWGKEINGLQAGLGFPAGQKRTYSHGETVTLVVRIRNVGKDEVTFQYVPAFFQENPPTLTHGAGKGVMPIQGVNVPGKTHPATDVTIAPGKEVELYERNVRLAHDPVAGGADNRGVIYGTGKFSVQYERVLGNSSASRIKIDPGLSKLATGKLELEVKEPEKQQQKKEEKESFTAWGKEVGGLQAGLGFRPGEQRAYHHGETVTLVLRVRNPGDESDGIPQAVEFNHIWAFFVENPPTITDADGKVVQLPGFSALGLQMPRTTTVVPGKEVVLYEWSFDLRPSGESGHKGSLTIHGTGKFSLQCERIVGPTSANPNHPNPAMSKLATEKLELEINPKPPAEKK